jgi:hypothetical protein
MSLLKHVPLRNFALIYLIGFWTVQLILCRILCTEGIELPRYAILNRGPSQEPDSFEEQVSVPL